MLFQKDAGQYTPDEASEFAESLNRKNGVFGTRRKLLPREKKLFNDLFDKAMITEDQIGDLMADEDLFDRLRDPDNFDDVILSRDDPEYNA